MDKKDTEQVVETSLLSRVPRNLWVAVAGWVGKIVTALVQVVSIRLLVEGLGKQQYGVFAVLSSLNGWYALADMGLGNSLQNYISEARARDEDYSSIVVAACIGVLCLILISIILLWFLSPILSSRMFRQLTVINTAYYNKIFFTTGAIFIVTALGTVGYKIWYAYQKGYLSNTLPALGALLGLIGIWAVAGLPDKNADLWWYILAYYVPVALLAVTALGINLGPMLRRVNWHEVKRSFKPLFQRGIQFWFFGLMAAGVLNIDYIIMLQRLSGAEITLYNILSRLFGFIFFFYSALLLSVWPVCAELFTQQKGHTVTRLIKKYILFGLGIVVLGTLLLKIFLPFIFSVLAPSQNLCANFSTIMLFGIYFMVRVWTDTYAMALQSVSDMKILWLAVPVQALISVGMQWKLSSLYGINGILCGLIMSYLLTVCWVLPLRFRHNVKTIMYEQ